MFKNKSYLILGLICLYVFVIFLSVVNFEFLNWDDQESIINNSFISEFTILNIVGIFTNFFVGMYKPITTLFFAIENFVFGFNASVFHFNSLLIHIINIVLVFILLKKFELNNFIIYITVLIFGIHTIQVESVAWLSARSTLIYSMFYLISLIMYINFLLKGKNLYLYLSIAAFILSVLSKPSAISFILVIPLLHFYFSKKYNIKSIIYLIFVFLVSITILIVTFISRPDIIGLNEIKYFNFLENTIFVLWSVIVYIYNFTIPINLSVLYYYPDKITWYIVALIILVFGIITVCLFKFSNKKQILLGLLLFIIPLSVHLKILPFGEKFMADRYMYLSVIGISIFLTTIIYNLFEKKPFLKKFKIILFSLFFILLSINTLTTLKKWKNSETLWSSVILDHPTKTIGYYNLGIYYKNKGNILSAISNFTAGLKVDIDNYKLYFARGVAHSSIKENEKALNDFNKVLEINPEFYQVYLNRANLYNKMNNFLMAMKDYIKYLQFVGSDESVEFKIILCKIEANYSIQELNTALLIFVEKYPKNKEANYLLGLTFININNNNACKYLKVAADLNHLEARRKFINFCLPL